MIFSKTIPVLGVAITCVLAGCAAESGEGQTNPTGVDSVASDSDDGDPNETFTETVMSQKADGTFEVASRRTVTRAEQIAAREKRLAAKDSKDLPADSGLATRNYLSNTGTTCTSSSLELFTKTNFTGNHLCFNLVTSPLWGFIDLSAIADGDACGSSFAEQWWGSPLLGCTCTPLICRPLIGTTGQLNVGSLTSAFAGVIKDDNGAVAVSFSAGASMATVSTAVSGGKYLSPP